MITGNNEHTLHTGNTRNTGVIVITGSPVHTVDTDCVIGSIMITGVVGSVVITVITGNNGHTVHTTNTGNTGVIGNTGNIWSPLITDYCE